MQITVQFHSGEDYYTQFHALQDHLKDVPGIIVRRAKHFRANVCGTESACVHAVLAASAGAWTVVMTKP